MASRVISVMGFLPVNIQIRTLFRAPLRVRHGTDRPTDDGHQRLMPPLYGGGGILIILLRYHQ